MPTTADNYYRAALRLLRFVEHRSPTQRRFGPEADAAWSQFRGDLTTADRIQLMIADAHAQWPGSVGASAVYAMAGVAADDAFGADWKPLGGIAAEEEWKVLCSEAPPTSVHEALEAIAAAWGLMLQRNVAPPPVKPGQLVLVAGPSAVAALVEHFATASDLNWGRQVVTVATPPGHRQLAAAAGVLLNLTMPAPNGLLSANDRIKPVPGALVFASDDADVADASRAGELAA